jgi:hypothetical protein
VHFPVILPNVFAEQTPELVQSLPTAVPPHMVTHAVRSRKGTDCMPADVVQVVRGTASRQQQAARSSHSQFFPLDCVEAWFRAP